MSDTSQGHGWWQASDGRFYPPELHPDFRPSPTPPQTSTAVLAPPVQSYTQFSQPVANGPRKRKKPLWRRWWMITIALLIALMVIMSIAAPPEDEGASGQRADEASGAPALDTPQEAAIEAAPPEPAPESNLTPSQQNAVRSAESYLDLMGFSRQGLIDQLEFEQFSTSDATIAVDSLTVDWNAEAAESAASYLDTMAFSCGGLTDQLEFEKFTPEQAAFGASQTGIC